MILLALALASSAPASPPPTAGTISIEPAGGEAAPPSFVAAVNEALGARGLTMLEQPGHAGFVAELTVTREQVGTTTAEVESDGAAITPGDAIGRVGAGISIALPTNKARITPLVRTRLDLRIRRRGEADAAWQASAVTVRPAGTRAGQDAAVAGALAEAMLRLYPAAPTATISVP
jgi:hypothetical protein